MKRKKSATKAKPRSNNRIATTIVTTVEAELAHFFDDLRAELRSARQLELSHMRELRDRDDKISMLEFERDNPVHAVEDREFAELLRKWLARVFDTRSSSSPDAMVVRALQRAIDKLEGQQRITGAIVEGARPKGESQSLSIEPS